MASYSARTPVYEFDKDKKFVKRYANCHKAANAKESTYEAIYAAARTQTKHRSGYWSFAKEFVTKYKAF